MRINRFFRIPLTYYRFSQYSRRMITSVTHSQLERQQKIKRLEQQRLPKHEVTEEIYRAKRAADEHLQRFKKLENTPPTSSPLLSFIEKILSYFSPKPFEEISIPEKRRKEVNPISDKLGVGATLQGHRPYMEDRVLFSSFIAKIDGCEIEVSLSAVFDGHGGSACAEHAVKNIADILKKNLEQCERSDEGIWNALTQSYVELTESFTENVPGTTANVAVMIGSDLWIANAGDSTALVLDDQGNIIRLSEPTLLSDNRYAEEVKQRFGKVVMDEELQLRVNGILTVPVAIGNRWANGAISSRPSIVKLESPKNVTLIQYSDGVEANPLQVVKRFLNLKNKGMELLEIVKDIAAAAKLNGSRDNISVLIRSIV